MLPPLGISVGFAVLVSRIPTFLATTVAVLVALTGEPPDVPVAVALLVAVEERLRVEVHVALVPGLIGPHEQTVKSSVGSPGVALSSANVPEAGKKFPVFVMV